MTNKIIRKLEDRLHRAKMATWWRTRLNDWRTINGKDYRDFYKRYRLNESVMSRIMSGEREAPTPLFKRVEKALAKEGV